MQRIADFPEEPAPSPELRNTDHFQDTFLDCTPADDKEEISTKDKLNILFTCDVAGSLEPEPNHIVYT